MTLKALVFFFFFLNLSSAFTLTTIKGFPSNIIAGSTFDLSYQACLYHAQNYQIIFNITGNSTNITGEEFTFDKCDWDNATYVYVCNLSGQIGNNPKLGISVNTSLYIMPDNFSIKTSLANSLGEIQGCPDTTPHYYQGSGGGGGGGGGYTSPRQPTAQNNTTQDLNSTTQHPPTTINNVTNEVLPPNTTAQNDSWPVFPENNTTMTVNNQTMNAIMPPSGIYPTFNLSNDQMNGLYGLYIAVGLAFVMGVWFVWQRGFRGGKPPIGAMQPMEKIEWGV